MIEQIVTAIHTVSIHVPNAPPPAFVTGLAWGLGLGIFLSCLVVRRRGLASTLRRIGFGLLTLVPAMLACLLWGVWFGIMAAKGMLH